MCACCAGQSGATVSGLVDTGGYRHCVSTEFPRRLSGIFREGKDNLALKIVEITAANYSYSPLN